MILSSKKHLCMKADIIATLEQLGPAELNKIRLRVWHKFGRQLRNIPDVPTSDDLLYEAMKDLLSRLSCRLTRPGPPADCRHRKAQLTIHYDPGDQIFIKQRFQFSTAS